jgi:hypothetical protein
MTKRKPTPPAPQPWLERWSGAIIKTVVGLAGAAVLAYFTWLGGQTFSNGKSLAGLDVKMDAATQKLTDHDAEFKNIRSEIQKLGKKL